MKQTLLLSACLMALSGLSALSIFAQNSTLKIASFQIEKPDESNVGKLFITVGGKRKMIAEKAVDAWIINDGREIVYTGQDGAGGFENEGQSLRIYNLETAVTRKIMSEYSFILGVSEVELSNRAAALLVRMGDGGLGASYFAVIDPKRGQVLSRNWAELTEIKGDTINLAFYKERDWSAIFDERSQEDDKNREAVPLPTKVKPYKTETHDLKKILKNKVIYNKTNEEMAAEYTNKYKDVVVYLWHPNEKPPEGKNYFMMAVSKNISAKNAFAPLRPTLELLFSGADKSDERDGFASSTFRMKFEGVILKNGTATVKFSQPPNETNYGSLAPFIFLEAVERTARQFPTVKKVEICAVGETLIDFQLDKQFPRCPQ